MAAAIVDAGPLVAYFDRKDAHFDWAIARIRELDPPLLVCEPVLTETLHLVTRFHHAEDALFKLLRNGALSIAFRLSDHHQAVHDLMRKYRDLPMSLADACVVRMAEVYDRHAVLTLDSDFSVYRKHGRVPLTLISPS